MEEASTQIPHNIPPSPLQFTVDLYSLSDVEQMLSREEVRVGDLGHLEMSPIPRQFSLDLYSIEDLAISARNDDEMLLFSHPRETAPEVSPIPAQISIPLYSLPDIEDPSDPLGVIGGPPQPQHLSIGLYSITESDAIIHGNENEETRLDFDSVFGERRPSPEQISIDLHSSEDVISSRPPQIPTSASYDAVPPSRSTNDPDSSTLHMAEPIAGGGQAVGVSSIPRIGEVTLSIPNRQASMTISDEVEDPQTDTAISSLIPTQDEPTKAPLRDDQGASKDAPSTRKSRRLAGKELVFK